MQTIKIIAIIALLLIGFHLLLYGYLRRRMSAAKAAKEQDANHNSKHSSKHASNNSSNHGAKDA